MGLLTENVKSDLISFYFRGMYVILHINLNTFKILSQISKIFQGFFLGKNYFLIPFDTIDPSHSFFESLHVENISQSLSKDDSKLDCTKLNFTFIKNSITLKPSPSPTLSSQFHCFLQLVNINIHNACIIEIRHF